MNICSLLYVVSLVTTWFNIIKSQNVTNITTMSTTLTTKSATSFTTITSTVTTTTFSTTPSTTSDRTVFNGCKLAKSSNYEAVLLEKLKPLSGDKYIFILLLYLKMFRM